VQSKEAKQLSFVWQVRIAGVGLDAVEQVGLLVVVWGEDDEVDNTLKGLFW